MRNTRPATMSSGGEPSKLPPNRKRQLAAPGAGAQGQSGRSLAASRPPEGWLRPAPPQALGHRPLRGRRRDGAGLLARAFSDLRDKTQRGVLAEFLVALALGRIETRRKAWDDSDVTTGSGLRVEVKASGYLQSWAQAQHSRLSFGRIIARTLDANADGSAPSPRSAPMSSCSRSRPARTRSSTTRSTSRSRELRRVG